MWQSDDDLYGESMFDFVPGGCRSLSYPQICSVEFTNEDSCRLSFIEQLWERWNILHSMICSTDVCPMLSIVEGISGRTQENLTRRLASQLEAGQIGHPSVVMLFPKIQIVELIPLASDRQHDASTQVGINASFSPIAWRLNA
jgi:hypothetical protein